MAPYADVRKTMFSPPAIALSGFLRTRITVFGILMARSSVLVAVFSLYGRTGSGQLTQHLETNSKVRTCATLAMFQFMGGEIALVTAGEAKYPRRDLPTAARYMYLLPVGFYMVSILLVGVNVNYLDPRIYHPYVEYFSEERLRGITTAERSPFVIAIENAGITGLPGFLDACFLFSALTAA